MATTIEAQGHTVDEAIQIALNQLGVSRDKVEIDILHHPRRGLLGIGARRAKVRATIRESVMLDGEEFDMSGGADLDDKPRRRRRRGGRNRGERTGGERPSGDRPSGDRVEKAPARPATPQRDAVRTDSDRRPEPRRAGDEAAKSRNEGGRSDRRGGRGRGGEPRGDQRGEPRVDQRGGEPRGDRPEQRSDAPPRGGQDRDRRDSRDRSGPRGGQQPNDRRDRDSSGNRGRNDAPAPPRAQENVAGTPEGMSAERSQAPRPPVENRPRRLPENETPLDAAALDAIRVRAEELVRELLAKMGFASEVTSEIDVAAGEAVIFVRSDNEGLLIGRRGQTLDSLEHIVNRMALRGENYVEGRVLLDIGDYRRRRRESLEELAGRLRARAVGEKRTVQVSPMSPRDRRYFVQAFAEDEAVEVRALGAGFYRRVIVAPAGIGASAQSVSEASVEVEDDDLVSGFAEADH